MPDSDVQVSQHGYQPITEGYQPGQQQPLTKGYRPVGAAHQSAPPSSPPPPPSGGSNAMKPAPK